MNELYNYLNKILPFSTHEVELMVALFTKKDFQKNHYFAKDGEYSNQLGFVSSGVVRAFYRNRDGKEYNKTFFIENSFVGAYSSLITGQKNQINIQCLTDSYFFVADYRKILALYDDYPKIERIARVLAEQFFVSKERKEIELVTMDASERYEIFKKEYGRLENLIPQYQIASYLAITPTQLSRIRAKK